MATLRFPIFIILLTVVISCTVKKTTGLMDRWTMIGAAQEIIFRPDSTAYWIFKDSLLVDTFHLNYRINAAIAPNQIDLYNFNRGILKDKMLVGIIEFNGPDTIVLDFEPIDTWSEADSIRPTRFELDQKKYLVRK